VSNLEKMRETIGSNIKAHRTVNGLTQKQLAEMIGTHESHICHWETGNREPELTSVLKLCLALDCELEDLVGIAPDWRGWV
jgi:transcriptional regulator with XRE-family HTH domain